MCCRAPDHHVCHGGFVVPRCQAECLPGCHAPGPAGELQSAAPQPQPCSCKIAGNDTAALVQHSSVMSHSATGHRVCTQAALADSSQLHLPCLKDAAEQGGSSSALQPGLGPTRPGGLQVWQAAVVTCLVPCRRHSAWPATLGTASKRCTTACASPAVLSSMGSSCLPSRR